MIRLFRVTIPVRVFGLFTSEAALFFGCYILACYWQLDVDLHSYLGYERGIARIAAVALAFVLGAYFADLYSEIRVRSSINLVSRVMAILGVAAICEAFIGYSNQEWALPQSVVITGNVLALIVLSAWRLIYSGALATAIGSQKILFVGSAPLTFGLSQTLQDHPEMGMASVGYLADQPTESNALRWLGPIDEVGSVVARLKPDRVVLAMTASCSRPPVNELLDLRFAGVLVDEATTVYEQALGRVCIDHVLPYQLILSSEPGPRRWTVRIQTIYSAVIALIGLILIFPILALAAILVKLTSRGPVLYRQTRVGLHGELFTVYKLRSMYQNAEAGTGAVWARPNDSRITPVGRLLRKSRIDELPQLINVLKGEMSIVGPRPERPEFVRELSQTIPYYRQRHCVKPGITGWAQINHKYGDTIENTKIKLEYDLYYIKNLSPSLDAYIMFQTAKIMLLSRGAQ